MFMKSFQKCLNALKSLYLGLPKIIIRLVKSNQRKGLIPARTRESWTRSRTSWRLRKTQFFDVLFVIVRSITKPIDIQEYRLLHNTRGSYWYTWYIGYKGLRQVYLYAVQMYGGLFTNIADILVESWILKD